MYDAKRMDEVLIPSSGKMVLLDKLLPKLKREGHKVLCVMATMLSYLHSIYSHFFSYFLYSSPFLPSFLPTILPSFVSFYSSFFSLSPFLPFPNRSFSISPSSPSSLYNSRFWYSLRWWRWLIWSKSSATSEATPANDWMGECQAMTDKRWLWLSW